jgi:hypothetical protein
LYVLLLRTSENAYTVCPPVRSKFFIRGSAAKKLRGYVPAFNISLAGLQEGVSAIVPE